MGNYLFWLAWLVNPNMRLSGGILNIWSCDYRASYRSLLLRTRFLIGLSFRREVHDGKLYHLGALSNPRLKARL